MTSVGVKSGIFVASLRKDISKNATAPDVYSIRNTDCDERANGRTLFSSRLMALSRLAENTTLYTKKKNRNLNISFNVESTETIISLKRLTNIMARSAICTKMNMYLFLHE